MSGDERRKKAERVLRGGVAVEGVRLAGMRGRLRDLHVSGVQVLVGLLVLGAAGGPVARSLGEIGRVLGLCDRSVSRGVRHLERAGLLRVRRRWCGLSNEYELLLPAPAGGWGRVLREWAEGGDGREREIGEPGGGRDGRDR